MSSIYTNQKVCCNTATTSNTKIPEVNLHITLFFDGTCNNRINSEERENNNISYQNTFKKHPNDRKGEIPTQRNSFENEKSNVALLFENFFILEHADTNLYHSEYIEGVGTEDYLPDSQFGAALGDYGDRDLRSKVRTGCQKVAAFIKKTKSKKTFTIKQINFTVFGFSRGAAAARNFAYEVMREAYVEQTIRGGLVPRMISIKHPKGGVLGSLLPIDIPLKNVKVKYVGLFDTVSAFGLVHSNDVKELGLDAVAKADNVFQIAAIDEYRKKFELTTIDSAAGKGKQLFLPGCHSDIGGGNRNNTIEYIANLLPSPPVILAHDYYTIKMIQELYDKECESEIKRLQDEGWFLPSSVKKEKGKYIGNRNVTSGYSSIPLAIMIEESKDSIKTFGVIKIAKIPSPHNLDKTEYNVIKQVGSALLGGYSSMVNKTIDKSRIDANNSIAKNLKILRQQYLHISHNYTTVFGAMEPRIVNGKLLREEYKG